ncbi:hypothetical protein ATW78_07960 [Oenococcus oeni]|nr:hypothetical protein ATW78_10620 [Oenococcus oeni]OIK85156.1 hypothetical protein ATW78_07965 [Oenococcus oeni]OIK85162.1 hypothetical protein ATW78_07960 [Oenococcus oeni]OIL31800.1 hypothetical protein ATX08_10825 [Oenococcus oeni]OLQ32776.1 hypothetical protein ATX09_09975 [Oenococcus oeni]
MVDNLGNQLVDACEHIGLIGEAITSTFELLDLTVDTTGVVAVQVLWQLLQRQRCLFSSRITGRSMGPAMWT